MYIFQEILDESHWGVRAKPQFCEARFCSTLDYIRSSSRSYLWYCSRDGGSRNNRGCLDLGFCKEGGRCTDAARSEDGEKSVLWPPITPAGCEELGGQRSRGPCDAMELTM